MPITARLRIAFSAMLLACFALAGWDALSFQLRARYLPLAVAVVASVLCVITLVADWRAYRRDGKLAFAEILDAGASAGEEITTPDEERAHMKRTAYYFAWIGGFAVLLWLVGLVYASVAFLVAFLRKEGELGWIRSIGTALLMMAFLALMSELFNLHWPGYVFDDLLPEINM